MERKVIFSSHYANEEERRQHLVSGRLGWPAAEVPGVPRSLLMQFAEGRQSLGKLECISQKLGIDL